VLLGRNGIVGKMMASVGLSGGDQLLFNRATVVFAMTHTLLPLAVVTMLPVMNQIDRRLPMAALTLGRQSRPGLLAGVLPAFDARRRRGGSSGPGRGARLLHHAGPGRGPRDTMIGQLIILQINELQNWQVGSALATVLLLSAIATCITYDRIFGLSSLSGSGTRRVRPDGLVRRAGLASARLAGLVFGAIEEGWKRNIRGLRGGVFLSLYAWM